jgi:hypothetical protein
MPRAVVWFSAPVEWWIANCLSTDTALHCTALSTGGKTGNRFCYEGKISWFINILPIFPPVKMLITLVVLWITTSILRILNSNRRSVLFIAEGNCSGSSCLFSEFKPLPQIHAEIQSILNRVKHLQNIFISFSPFLIILRGRRLSEVSVYFLYAKSRSLFSMNLYST